MAPPWEKPPRTMRWEGMPEETSEARRVLKRVRERRIPGSSWASFRSSKVV
jgi:hypothetical protein